MSDLAFLIAVFWTMFLLDGAFTGRRASWSFTSRWGGQYALPTWRRWHGLSPWPGGWRAVADDLPFSFAPAGLCNRPAGVAGRPPNDLGSAQVWRWEDIGAVTEADGWLLINGKRMGAATGHLTAEELRDLAAACVPLAPAARADLLRARLRHWLRPTQLRRRARVLRARTAMLVVWNGLLLAGLTVLSAWFLGWLPAERIGADIAARVTRAGPVLLGWLAVLHGGGVALAWWQRRRLLWLAPAGRPRSNPLLSVLFFLPSALRLRALLGANWFPPTHPAAAALAFASPTTRDEVLFNVLSDLRWPLTSPSDGSAVAEITAWFRAALGDELTALLRRERIDTAALLAPPAPDGPTSRTFCPRCRAQFVGECDRCPHGVPLQPLK
jgi:hypothetical protein